MAPAPLSVDVLVIGAGTAGLPCALVAAQRGARVLLVEADCDIGGTLRRAAGHVSAGGTRLQRERGIQDDPATHAADVMRITQGAADPILVARACEAAPATIEWLDRSGMDWDPACPRILHSLEPYRIARTYWGRNRGVSILDVIRPQIDEAVAGGRLALARETRLTRFEVADGTVVGAELSDGRRVRATQTVLTTGGFAANPGLFARLTGDLRIITAADPHNDGSGLLAAEAIGARVRPGDRFQPHLGGIEDPPGSHRHARGDAPALMPARPPWEIHVDRAGLRWHREDDPDKHRSEAALMRVPAMTFWIVWDQTIHDQAPPLYPAWSAERIAAAWNRHPAFHRADTLDELAARTGIDAAGLHATVARYNEAGADAFAREHRPRPIAAPPFYAVENHGSASTSAGGLSVDRDLRVLKPDGSVIPGLYAAGEIIGREILSGDRFVGGMGLTPALAFGRLLSESVLLW